MQGQLVQRRDFEVRMVVPHEWIPLLFPFLGHWILLSMSAPVLLVLSRFVAYSQVQEDTALSTEVTSPCVPSLTRNPGHDGADWSCCPSALDQSPAPASRGMSVSLKLQGRRACPLSPFSRDHVPMSPPPPPPCPAPLLSLRTRREESACHPVCWSPTNTCGKRVEQVNARAQTSVAIMPLLTGAAPCGRPGTPIGPAPGPVPRVSSRLWMRTYIET